MTLSLVVLQHNHSELTLTCLDSLRESTVQPDEVIIVDAASEPEHTQLLPNSATRILLPNNPCSESAGLDPGWALAKSEFVLLSNNDVAFSSTTLERMLDAMEKYPRIAHLAAAQNFSPWASCTQPIPDNIMSELNATSGRDRRKFNEWAAALTTDIKFPQVLESTVVLTRSEATSEVGRFDPELYYWHTHDMYLKLRACAWNCAVSRDAVFWHAFGSPTATTSNWRKTNHHQLQVDKSTRVITERWGDIWRSLSG